MLSHAEIRNCEIVTSTQEHVMARKSKDVTTALRSRAVEEELLHRSLDMRVGSYYQKT